MRIRFKQKEVIDVAQHRQHDNAYGGFLRTLDNTRIAFATMMQMFRVSR